MKATIHFFFQEPVHSLKERGQLKLFLKKLFKKEKAVLKTLNIIFCSDKSLLELNKSYLKHNYFTDIITFVLSQPSSQIDAELYISIDRIKENAKKYDSSLKKELHRVIFHGCLHLCGYNDKSSQEIIAIRKAEDQYLRSYFK